MSPQPVERIAVLGAGTMGHGIAQVAAMSGYETTLFDIDSASLDQGLERVRANLDKGVDRGKVEAVLRDESLGRLSGTDVLADAVGDADLIIEAAPEKLSIKQRIFSEVSDLAPTGAILASNTSSLSVSVIAASAADPSRVVGMHFFNPVHILKLLEVVRAKQTADEVLATVQRVGEQMNRVIVNVNDVPGFASSRLGIVLGLEAIRMVEQGVAPAEDIDKAMVHGYKHPMGPLRLTDLVGLDVRLAIAEYLHRELEAEQFCPPALLRKMVAEGKLGKKSGEGFYRWDD